MMHIKWQEHVVKRLYCTCIKSQGASVVDYCLVPHEDLNKFTQFKVLTVTGLINEINIIETIEPDTSKPDHSILTWKIDIDIIYKTDKHKDDKNYIEITKYSRDIPTDFLQDKREDIRNLIAKLENSTQSQTDADENYTDFVCMIKQDMHRKVDHKKNKIRIGLNNKKRRIKKRGGPKN